MSFSYKPLWKLLVEKDMTKEQLRLTINASSSTMAKMSKNENVSMDILHKLCQTFDCQLTDLIKYIPDKGDDQNGL